MPTIEITTMIGCPLMCTFCPQDKLRDAYKATGGEQYLSAAAFQTVLDKVPDYVRIDFSGMAEPFANPNCMDFLESAAAAGRHLAIYTTLHGLKREDHERLASLLARHREQIEVFCLHLPDGNQNMRGVEISEDYVEALKLVLGLARDNGFRRFEMMTMDANGGLAPELAPLGKLPPWIADSRAGNVPAESGDVVGVMRLQRRIEAPVNCTLTPFYDQNVVLPNLDVLLCCMDYGAEHVLGNLGTMSYFEVFGSAAYARLIQNNVDPKGRSLCKSCDRANRFAVKEARQIWQIADAHCAS